VALRVCFGEATLIRAKPLIIYYEATQYIRTKPLLENQVVKTKSTSPPACSRSNHCHSIGSFATIHPEILSNEHGAQLAVRHLDSARTGPVASTVERRTSLKGIHACRHVSGGVVLHSSREWLREQLQRRVQPCWRKRVVVSSQQLQRDWSSCGGGRGRYQ
jgi:hypothetical protein